MAQEGRGSESREGAAIRGAARTLLRAMVADCDRDQTRRGRGHDTAVDSARKNSQEGSLHEAHELYQHNRE